MCTAALVAVAVAGTLIAVPRIERGKRDEAARERREAAAYEVARLRRLIREARPRRAAAPALRPGLGAAAPDQLALRRQLLDRVERSITVDGRARDAAGELDGPILRTACEPFPESTSRSGAEADLRARLGRYECVAVTGDLPGEAGGVIGYPFRVAVDFRRFSWTWCRVAGRPGEGSFGRSPAFTVPRACSG